MAVVRGRALYIEASKTSELTRCRRRGAVQVDESALEALPALRLNSGLIPRPHWCQD